MNWKLSSERFLLVGSVVAIGAMMGAPSVKADGIDQMEAQIERMQEQIRELRREVDAKKKDDTDLKVK